MHKESRMATRLSRNTEPLSRALVLSGKRTAAAAATRELEEFIARRRRRGLLDLMGKLAWGV
jgi:hypothetical protein